MSGVISGSALLAEAAAATNAATIAYKADDLSYDLGLLAAYDAHPLDPAELSADREAALLRIATENTQLLVKRVFEQPVEVTALGPVVRHGACCRICTNRCAAQQRTAPHFTAAR